MDIGTLLLLDVAVAASKSSASTRPTSKAPVSTSSRQSSGGSSTAFAGVGRGRVLGASAGSSSSRLPCRWSSAAYSTSTYPSPGTGQGSASRASTSLAHYNSGTHQFTSTGRPASTNLRRESDGRKPQGASGSSQPVPQPAVQPVRQYGPVSFTVPASNVDPKRLPNVSKRGLTRAAFKRQGPPPTAMIRTTYHDNPNWKNAAVINIWNSQFYALPTEILVVIAKMLDQEDKHAFRATCSLFMKLFSDWLLHDDWDTSKGGFLYPVIDNPWQYRLKKAAGLDAVARRTQLMRQQDLCAECMLFRTGNNTGFGSAAWLLENELSSPCRGCNVPHNQVFFPSKQRSQWTRLNCIGRGGAIRLCSHRNVRWSDLRDAGKLTRRRNGENTPNVRAEITCFHPSHALNAGVCTKFSYPSRLDPSHPPSCYPTLTIIRKAWGAKGRFNLVKRNTIYLFDIDPSQHVSLQNIRDIMKSLARSQPLIPTRDFYNTAQLCPHVTFADKLLLQAFWPSRCACFGMHAPLPWQGQQRALDVLPDRFQGDPNGVPLAECLSAAQRDPSRVGKFLQPGAVHLDVLAEVEGISKPLDERWLGLVHPDTWGVREKKGTKHILWCDGYQCAIGTKWEEHGRLNERNFPKKG
ncbi:hypothetical protein B0T14DRAFT_603083 [Immersiella caudata]|uniref:F-box domain-containing protein n=1 Tax=Immersiella caudata TaxID=314043 RepID=A0AA39WPJ5_9PEZI|nr:hypothetical protein B0T14DRAFT_603083 [Immersiella caudata]